MRGGTQKPGPVLLNSKVPVHLTNPRDPAQDRYIATTTTRCHASTVYLVAVVDGTGLLTGDAKPTVHTDPGHAQQAAARLVVRWGGVASQPEPAPVEEQLRRAAARERRQAAMTTQHLPTGADARRARPHPPPPPPTTPKRKPKPPPETKPPRKARPQPRPRLLTTGRWHASTVVNHKRYKATFDTREEAEQFIRDKKDQANQQDQEGAD